MSATLKLSREGMFIELHRGIFDVLVDGLSVGPIELHQPIETPVAPGHHTLRIRKGRYSSRVRAFDVADGGVVRFRCYGANIWPLYLLSLLVPTLGISLKNESSPQ